MSAPRLSVCIPLMNDSRVEVEGHTLYPLPNCIRALAHALSPKFDAEVVVADFGSTDWPPDKWLATMARPLPTRIVRLEGHFSVGKGFNAAADAAKSDRLLFLGADMLVSRVLIKKGHALLDRGIVYFPLVWSYTNPEHTAGRERPYGRGNVFMTKAMRTELGPWREFKSHGKSDDAMWARAKREFEVEIEQRKDFFHQWHPNNLEWKNRHYGPDWRVDHDRKVKAYHEGTLLG